MNGLDIGTETLSGDVHITSSIIRVQDFRNGGVHLT